MKNYNKPANPIVNKEGFCSCFDSITSETAIGLTKLEQGALMITQGIIVNCERNQFTFSDIPEIAKTSVEISKAILEACEKESEV